MSRQAAVEPTPFDRDRAFEIWEARGATWSITSLSGEDAFIYQVWVRTPGCVSYMDAFLRIRNGWTGTPLRERLYAEVAVGSVRSATKSQQAAGFRALAILCAMNRDADRSEAALEDSVRVLSWALSALRGEDPCE